MRIPRVLLFAAMLIAAAWPALGADVQVKAKDRYFTPSLRTITVGDTVQWRNDGDLEHTVTSFSDAPAPFDSSQDVIDNCDDGNPLTDEDCIEVGDTFSVTFTKPGIYDYRCKPHGNEDAKPTSGDDQSRPCAMCGRIDVREAAGKPPAPTSTPTLKRTRTPTATATPTGSTTATPTDGTPTPEETDGTIPVAASGGASGGDGSGRALVALLAIGALSGAGFLTWRRFLASR